MAEFTNPNIVTVSAGENLPLTETAVKGPACIVHREGAGIVTLRGLTNQCKARFKVSFGGNIAVPTGGTAGAISVALAIAGEPLNSATAIVTPAAAGTTLMCSPPPLSRFRALLRDCGSREHQHAGDRHCKQQSHR